jgi:hypothetical protein
MGTRTIKPYSNNDGQIGSSSKYWDKGYFNSLHVNNIYTSTTGLTTNTLQLSDGSIRFEGSGVDDHETNLVVENPTADRTITLPDATGTLALTSDIAVTTLNGTTSNGICTYASSGTIDVETAITFNVGVITIESTAGILTTATNTSADSEDIYLKSGHTATGNNLSGGDVYIQSGNSTGTGTGSIKFSVPKPQGTGNGLNLTSLNIAGDISATTTQNILKVLEPGTGTDAFSVLVSEHGATTLSTTDGNAEAAHLTLNADGNITLTTPDMHYSTSIKRRKMSVTSSTDHDHDGDVVYFGAASGVSQGDICFLSKDGSNNATWYQAVADQEAKSTSLLAISLGTDPATDGMLLRGMFTLDENTADNNFGDPVYLSDTSAGGATMTAPSDNNDVVRVIGYKMGNDDEIWFCPDNTWVVVSA